MQVLKSNHPTYFDVDGTLALWKEETFIPNEAIITSIKQHHERGHTVIVWSAGGVNWATRVVLQFGLERYVDYVIAKPSWVYDDLPASEFIPESHRFWFTQFGDKKK